MADWARRYTWELLLLAILLGTIVFNITQSSGYLGVDNFVNLFQLHIEKVIVVVTMTFVIISGEIDLSVASVMAWSASVLAALHEHDVPFAAGDRGCARRGRRRRPDPRDGASPGSGCRRSWSRWPASSAGGAPRGCLSRTARSGASPIGSIASARTASSDRSRSRCWSSSRSFVAGWVILHRSAAGRVLYVIGDNAEVARYSGCRRRPRLASCCSRRRPLVAGLAGILFAARLGTVRGDMATGFELEVITIVLLGGVSIFGGSGRMSGVFLAVLIVLNLRNGFGLANVGGNTQTGVIGAILIGSVLAQNLIDWLRRAQPGPGPVHARPACTSRPSRHRRRAHEPPASISTTNQ